MRKDSIVSFVEKAVQMHGNKYDYSKVEYVNTRTPVTIICSIHGEFRQTPSAHLHSKGCPKCAIKDRIMKRRDTLDTFVEKARKKYGAKYDYSEVEYVNARTPVKIVCPIHGEFVRRPLVFLNGNDCPRCKQDKRIEKKEQKEKELNNSKIRNKQKREQQERDNFVKQVEHCREIFKNKYDYSLVKIDKTKDKVPIICPVHGTFYQLWINHVKGHGCPKCANEALRKRFALSREEFVRRSAKVHNGKYDYSKVNYVNNRTKVCIVCSKHGEFWQTPAMHLSEKQGCPLCGTLSSAAETEIYNFLNEKLNTEIIQRDRHTIRPKEIDIMLPEYKLGIEYNGLKWHTEMYGKDRYYHLSKLNECNRKGIRLINIFSDEYDANKKLVLLKILHILGANDALPLYARKTKVCEISKEDKKHFLERNHIQGDAQSSIDIGCLFGGQIVAVMTFMKKGGSVWELNRFATEMEYRCVGMGEKLFKFFLSKYEPSKVISFADRRWTVDAKDNMYIKLGFVLDNVTPPDYCYYCKDFFGEKRVHKFNFRKKLLSHKFGLPLEMTEREMAEELDAYRIWNCGLFRFVYINN